MHRALIIALAVGVGLSCGAENAFATHVGCGDLVTTDVRLDSDLVGCPGPGLVVGADDITIDLRGHTIAGALAGAGVDDTGQHDRLVIENGTITGFYDGVFLKQSSGSAVRRLEISHVFQGVELLDSPENAVERNSISDATSGGISVEGESDRNRVEKNSVSRAGAGVQLSPEVQPTRTPDDNLIVKNELAPGGIGVAFGGTALRNRVERNVFHDNATGVFALDADGNVIERNDVIRGGLGMILIDSDDNRLSRNRVEELFLGILVLDGSQGTILEGNTASRNQDDGIKVLAASTTLTGNVANDNGDLGIDAVPGVIDGGGNRASGNGNPAQCVSVACR